MKIDCAHDAIVDINSLKPHARNTNEHPKEQIDYFKKVLEYQGQRKAVVVSNLSKCITKGHGLVMSAKEIGAKEIAVDYQDYEDEAQEYADIEADNHLAKLAVHNLEMMKENIFDLELDKNGFNLDLLGVPDLDLSMPDPERDAIEDEVPEVTESISKLGDIYELGEHRLLCGDSTDKATVERLMNGAKADMVFTDPPYGVGYKYNSHDDDVTKDEHFKFLKKLIKDATELADRFILTPGCNNLDAISIEPKPTHVGCWTKTNAMSPGRITHFWTWEPILFYGKWKRKRGNDVFNFPVGKQPDTGDHTCPKPIALWQDIVENFSDASESVLDLFGGSGSTLIACEKTKRKCFMMELDEHYIQVIIERWMKYTGRNDVYLLNEDGTKTIWKDLCQQRKSAQKS